MSASMRHNDMGICDTWKALGHREVYIENVHRTMNLD